MQRNVQDVLHDEVKRKGRILRLVAEGQGARLVLVLAPVGHVEVGVDAGAQQGLVDAGENTVRLQRGQPGMKEGRVLVCGLADENE